MKPRIAVSISFEAPDPQRHLFKGKPLQYIEQGMVQAVFAAGGIPFLVPSWEGGSRVGGFSELMDSFDGLLLTGGMDVSPQSYGQVAKKEEWEGDLRRDLYEMGLLEEALSRRLPILGVCRGCQLMNVALGGSLFQDITSESTESLSHRDQDLYDQLFHPVSIEASSILGGILGQGERGKVQVNSVHHQAVRELGEGLRVAGEAPDGVIEALEGEAGFLVGVQWHPEWLDPGHALGLKVFEAFIHACGT